MECRCRHRGEKCGTRITPFGGELQYTCTHSAHAKTPATAATCLLCRDWVAIDTTLGGRNHPADTIVNRDNVPVAVAGLYEGASVFLVLGGPSLGDMPLDLLARRGAVIMSTNNCAAALPWPLRPHIWLHTDPVQKFHEHFWRDPAILKFSPVREWKKPIRARQPDGSLAVTAEPARSMPGCLGFLRNTEFLPDNWLWEPTINRGNDEKHSTKKGGKWPHTINTMFAALRLAFYLGFKTVYLLGADFKMDPARPYAFSQEKSAGGCQSNNWAFENMGVMFSVLRGKFETAGYNVVNCTPESGLRAFDFLPFETAIERATGAFEQELVTDGWYEKS